jgi:hypothetical protein
MCRRLRTMASFTDECYTEDLGVMWPSPIENRLTVNGDATPGSGTANAAFHVSVIDPGPCFFSIHHCLH